MNWIHGLALLLCAALPFAARRRRSGTAGIADLHPAGVLLVSPLLDASSGDDSSPWAMWIYAKALLAAPGHTLDVLLAGHMQLQLVGTLALHGQAGAPPVQARLLRLFGLDLEPHYLAVDANDDMLADIDDGSVLPAHAPNLSHMPIAYQRYRQRTFVPDLDAQTDAQYRQALDKTLQLIGRLHRQGTVLLPGDPITDITAIRQPALVVKDQSLYLPTEIYRALGVAPFAPAPKKLQ